MDTKVMKSVGLKKEAVTITNSVYCLNIFCNYNFAPFRLGFFTEIDIVLFSASSHLSNRINSVASLLLTCTNIVCFWIKFSRKLNGSNTTKTQWLNFLNIKPSEIFCQQQLAINVVRLNKVLPFLESLAINQNS